MPVNHPDIPDEFQQLGVTSVNKLREFARSLGLDRTTSRGSVKSVVQHVLAIMDQMGEGPIQGPTPISNGENLMGALLNGKLPQPAQPGLPSTFGDSIEGRMPGGATTTGPGNLPDPTEQLPAQSKALLRLNKGKGPVPPPAKSIPRGPIPVGGAVAKALPEGSDMASKYAAAALSAGQGGGPGFLGRVLKGAGKAFKRNPVLTGLGAVATAAAGADALVGWGQEASHDLSGGTFDEQLDYEINNQIRNQIQQRKAQELQRVSALNTARLAAADPHLYNEVLAGRRLPPGAVVIGGTPRQDLMGQLAAAMSMPQSPSATSGSFDSLLR
jgi:hypothetical protein